MADAVESDLVKVERGGTLYQLQVGSLASLLDDDIVEVERGGVVYKETGLNVKADLPTGGGYDPDAQDYIDRVEAADGEALENAVKDAIDVYVKQLKADNQWYKCVCILPCFGARTLTGASEFLKYPIGFPSAATITLATSGDYDRINGFASYFGLGKYLDAAGTTGECVTRNNPLNKLQLVDITAPSNVDQSQESAPTYYELCGFKLVGSQNQGYFIFVSRYNASGSAVNLQSRLMKNEGKFKGAKYNVDSAFQSPEYIGTYVTYGDADYVYWLKDGVSVGTRESQPGKVIGPYTDVWIRFNDSTGFTSRGTIIYDLEENSAERDQLRLSWDAYAAAISAALTP